MVSVIIPVYNSRQYLTRCLDSCFMHNYQDIEVIAVNDGSVDGSDEVLNAYASRESRLKVIHQKNQGVTQARKCGFENSSGDWLFFLDSDDTIPDNALDTLIDKAKCTDSDLIVGDFKYLNVREEFIRRTHNKIINNDILESLFRFKIDGCLCAKLIRRNLFSKISFPTSKIKIGEDVICTIQLYSLCNSAEIVETVVYNYYQYPNSAINSHKKENVESMVLYLKLIDSYVSTNCPQYQSLTDEFLIFEYFAYLMYGGEWNSFSFFKKKYDHISTALPLKMRLAYTPFGKVFILIGRLLKQIQFK